jgi:hypothetical protein
MRLSHIWQNVRLILAAAVIVFLVLASFFVVQALSQQGPPDDPAALATLAADSAKPRFTGIVAGIRLHAGGADQGPDAGCTELFHPVDFALTNGTPFEIDPDYLPPGIGGERKPAATACRGDLVSSGRSWGPAVAGNPWIWIYKILRPEPWENSEAPAERISEGRINGQPAVFVRPPLADGRGDSAVITAERIPQGFVVTIVLGSDVRFAELVKVAEGLVK